MSEGLGLVNTKLPLEDNLETLRANGIEVSKKLLNIGATILKDKTTRNPQNITSTSYVAVSEFQASIKCSGGVVIFIFQPWIYANGLTLFVELYIDDVAEKTYSFFSTDATSISASFLCVKELLKGNHTVKYKAKVTGGTAVIGDSQYDSTLCIVEFNGGA